MNRWRLTITLLVLASLFLILGATLIDWEPWDSFRFLRKEWNREPTYMRNPRMMFNLPPLLTALVALFTLYLSGILVLLNFPAQIRRMEKAFSDTLGGLARLAVLGLFTTILVIAVSVSSALTMGTFPLTITLGSILFLCGFFGFIALAYTLGHKLFTRADWEYLSPLYALLVGLLILFSLSRLPLVGIIFTIVFTCLGIGGIIATRFGSGLPWDLSPLKDE